MVGLIIGEPCLSHHNPILETLKKRRLTTEFNFFRNNPKPNRLKMKKKINLSRIVFAALVGFIVVIAMNYKRMGDVAVVDFATVVVVVSIFAVKEVLVYLHYQSSVKKGVDLVRKNSVWGINNMIVTKSIDDQNRLTVRNDLLWGEKKQSMGVDALLALLVADFEEMAGEPVLKAYLRHKSVTYNLYSYDLREEQLLLSKVKEYGA